MSTPADNDGAVTVTLTATALRRVWSAALAGFDLATHVRAAVTPYLEHEPKPLRAFAVGKAALAMLEGALDAGVEYHETIVIIPEGLRDRRGVIARASADSFTAAHPVPDQRSERAGQAVLALAQRSALEGGTLHAFISGGASSLMCVPWAAVDLATKARVTTALLASGADVRAINTVRRHLSLVKGGGVLRAAGPALVHTFVVSDVLGGEPHDVGSGPTVIDPTTVEDAREVLERFAPEFASLPLVETTKRADVAGERARVTMIAEARDFAAHVCAMLVAEGFDAKLDRTIPSDANIEALATELTDDGVALKAGEALVRCVEPSLVVADNRGGGGRATHLAAMLATRIPEGVACLVGATDGVDGGSETGGAVVTRETASRDSAALAASIQHFAAARYLSDAGAALAAGPTGLNFADIVVLARAR